MSSYKKIFAGVNHFFYLTITELLLMRDWRYVRFIGHFRRVELMRLMKHKMEKGERKEI